MVAVEFRTELEDTDLDRTLAARLSCGPVGRLPGVHGREATGCALQVSVLPRRGPLGATTAQSPLVVGDRKSTRLNSSHLVISYAVFCLKKKTSNYTPAAALMYPHNI